VQRKQAPSGIHGNSGSNLVQMKCACGGSSEECEECRAKREEEISGGQLIQKKCAACEEEEERIQHKEASGGQQATVHGTARAGIEGANQPLPHLERIQNSFGHHDVTTARVASSGPAARANARMGSLAYTAGDRIAFRGEPDVKLAAHEAAHVVQQRSGAKLPGGAGRPGDEYEQQADAVAEAVDREESAEPILDRTISPGPTASEPVVQHALAVNAFRLFEPAALATHVAVSSAHGEGGRRGGR